MDKPKKSRREVRECAHRVDDVSGEVGGEEGHAGPELAQELVGDEAPEERGQPEGGYEDVVDDGGGLLGEAQAVAQVQGEDGWHRVAQWSLLFSFCCCCCCRRS